MCLHSTRSPSHGFTWQALDSVCVHCACASADAVATTRLCCFVPPPQEAVRATVREDGDANLRVVQVADGGEIAVTEDNREEYVAAYVEWKLGTSVARQFDAFRRGFERVCGGSALDLFRGGEMLAGASTLAGDAFHQSDFDRVFDSTMCDMGKPGDRKSVV